MSEVFKTRSQQEGGTAPGGGAKPPEPPRIQIDVPLGTPYQEIQESIFRQAYRLTGTQLRAAIALGIIPDSVARVMQRMERRKAGYLRTPEAWPVPAPPPPADRLTGRPADRVTGRSEDRAGSGPGSSSVRPPSVDRAPAALRHVAIAGTHSSAVDPAFFAAGHLEETGGASDINNQAMDRAPGALRHVAIASGHSWAVGPTSFAAGHPEETGGASDINNNDVERDES
jgi:hypothetical protein